MWSDALETRWNIGSILRWMQTEARMMGTEQGSLSLNSALVWGPAMADVASQYDGLQVPRTQYVDIDAENAMNWIDGASDEFAIEDIEAAAEHIGYPVFIRTDITSAKHQGLKGIRARDEDELRTAVRWALESNFMAMAIPHPKSIAVREWVDFQWAFSDESKMTDSETRIAREFRAFVDTETLHCVHFYWPKDSIDNPSVDDWEKHHDGMNYYRPEDKELFRDFGTDVADRLPKHDEWSVDFAAGQDGDWWAIDMAVAQRSWHPDDCPNEWEAELV